MRILIFHGYLLGGTGSNVYNARLAQALVRLGHEVHLLTQDRHPEAQPFIDAAGDWDGGELRVSTLRTAPVRCTHYRPDIGGLLPVYVQDRYEGIEARTFAACSRGEIERYIQANIDAVREIVSLVRPDLALANHLVMGPVILARALDGELPYAVKIHGSALEYTVKPQPERFLGLAREGLAGASGVLVGSTHTAQSLWEALGEGSEGSEGGGVRSRTRLGPPGVDVHEFQPMNRTEAGASVRALTQRLAGQPAFAEDREDGGDAFAREESHAAEALAKLDLESDRIVVYVGKLIVSKGVDLLLAAWPLVLAEVPRARLVVVGFGALREGLEELVAQLGAGDLDAARVLALRGRELEGSSPGPLWHLLAFLDALSAQQHLREAYLEGAAELPERVLFTGRLDHTELVSLLPICEALIVPSTFPESFGMVAVEGAACGVLPVSAAHSGLLEVSDTLAQDLPPEVGRLLSFPIDDDAVRALSTRVIGWLRADPQLRSRTSEALVASVRGRWSWESVAEGVMLAARGELDELRRP